MLKRLAYETGRALRETGQALDRVGLRAMDKPSFKEPFSRHRAVMNLYEKHPTVENNVFVAPSASVIGHVEILHKSSVWYGAVVRGDLNPVEIGGFTAIQDRAVVHTAKSVEGRPAAVCRIGDHVTVGPGAVLQSCTVENACSIGAGAVVMEGALVETHSIVAPGAVVHPGRRIPSGQLWSGNPATFERNLSKEEMARFEEDAEFTADLAKEHSHEFLPEGGAYKDVEAKGL